MKAPAEYEYFEMPPISNTIGLACNTERKCVLTLLADPGEVVSAVELGHRLDAAQEPYGKTGFSGTAQLLKDSHVRAGVFETVAASGTNTVREVVKAQDSTLNDAAAGLMLGLSAFYGVGLTRFLGASRTLEGSLSAPQSVLLLSGFFATQPAGSKHGVTIDQLAAASGAERHAIIHNVRRLRRFGYVEYVAAPLATEIARFAINFSADPYTNETTLAGDERQTEKPTHAGAPTYRSLLTGVIERFMHQGVETFGYDDLIRALGPDYAHVTQEQLHNSISAFARDGVVDRLHRSTQHGDAFSNIYCTASQKAIFDRVAYAYEGLASNNPDVIAEGLAIGQAIMDDKQTVARVLQRSYRDSAAANRDWHKARARVVTLALMGNIERSTADILDHFEPGTFTAGALGHVLRRMRDEGQIVGRKEGGQKYWRWANS